MVLKTYLDDNVSHLLVIKLNVNLNMKHKGDYLWIS